MTGTFLYLHGTTEQDQQANQARIEARLHAQPPFEDWTVRCPPWGAAVGPPDLDVRPALPLRYQADAATAADAEVIVEFATDLYAHTPTAELGVGTAGFADLALHLLTDVIAKHRVRLTNGLADFLRYVLFYLREDSLVRAYVGEAIDAAIADTDGPVVVAGHSLGGVIGVDVLTQRPRDIRLLVTAGSQSSLFWLMGVPGAIRRDPPRRDPFAPWLNVLNPRDPLAFRAGEVFAWADQVPEDAVLETPEDLLGAHTGYFGEPELYALIATRLGA